MARFFQHFLQICFTVVFFFQWTSEELLLARDGLQRHHVCGHGSFGGAHWEGHEPSRCRGQGPFYADLYERRSSTFFQLLSLEALENTFLSCCFSLHVSFSFRWPVDWPLKTAISPGLQGEQARDLHGQRLQRGVARGGPEARLAQPEHHAQSGGHLELRKKQAPWPEKRDKHGVFLLRNIRDVIIL